MARDVLSLLQPSRAPRAWRSGKRRGLISGWACASSTPSDTSSRRMSVRRMADARRTESHPAAAGAPSASGRHRATTPFSTARASSFAPRPPEPARRRAAHARRRARRGVRHRPARSPALVDVRRGRPERGRALPRRPPGVRPRWPRGSDGLRLGRRRKPASPAGYRSSPKALPPPPGPPRRTSKAHVRPPMPRVSQVRRAQTCFVASELGTGASPAHATGCKAAAHASGSRNDAKNARRRKMGQRSRSGSSRRTRDLRRALGRLAARRWLKGPSQDATSRVRAAAGASSRSVAPCEPQPRSPRRSPRSGRPVRPARQRASCGSQGAFSRQAGGKRRCRAPLASGADRPEQRSIAQRSRDGVHAHPAPPGGNPLASALDCASGRPSPRTHYNLGLALEQTGD